MEIPVGIKKAAVLCILTSEKGLLLLRRSKEPHVDKYIPIGGKIEPFETPKAAVIRETLEETSITILNPHLRGIMTETSPTKFNWVNYIYSAEISAIVPPECNEGILEWVALSDLGNIPTPTTDRFIYDYLVSSEFFVLNAVYDADLLLLHLEDELTENILYRGKY